MYLVDLVAVILVSCIVMIAGLLVMSCWRFGRVVFKDAAFHVVMWVLRFVAWLFEVCVGGLLVNCGGCEYSFNGSLYFNISLRSVSGRNGNLFVNMLRFMFWLFCFMKLYISL